MKNMKKIQEEIKSSLKKQRSLGVGRNEDKKL